MPVLLQTDDVTPDEQANNDEYRAFLRSLLLDKLHTIGLASDESKRGVRRKLNKLAKESGLTATYRMNRETDTTVCVILSNPAE